VLLGLLWAGDGDGDGSYGSSCTAMHNWLSLGTTLMPVWSCVPAKQPVRQAMFRHPRVITTLFSTPSPTCPLPLQTLGQLILALACGSSGLAMPSLEYASQQFSMELIRLLAALLAAVDGGSLSTVRQLAGALGERMLVELDSRSMINDSMVGAGPLCVLAVQHCCRLHG
jgi:hypothetical protein